MGVDGSEGSYAALAWAIEEAGRRGALLDVVHAWQLPYVAAPVGLIAPPTEPHEYEVAATGLLDSMIDGCLARTEGPRPEVERISVCDHPGHALLETAKGADLLVVGSRGRGGFLGLLLGSVSHQCVTHAGCPVVVVPAPHEHEKEA